MRTVVSSSLMTSEAEGKTRVVRRPTIPQSAAWKEQLRESCLRRALHHRAKRARQERQDDDDDDAFESPESRKRFRGAFEYHTSPRLVLEEELRHRGVHIESPVQCMNEKTETEVGVPADAEMEEASLLRDNGEEELVGGDGSPYTMSEDEFIELLEEFESDLDLALLEEELDLEEGLLQDQIASYENNQSAQYRNSSLSCPVCFQGCLESVLSDDGSCEIVCSRAFVGHKSYVVDANTGFAPCSFHLAPGVTTLERLIERIETATTTHADYCDESLTFACPSPNVLTGSCRACGTLMRLYG